MSFVDALPYVAVAAGAVVVTALTMYAMMGKKRTTPISIPKTRLEPKAAKMPFPTDHTVSDEEALEARNKLRTLELEREILSDAIRRLYEAQVEGKISEQERDRLAENYKTRMMKVKDAIAKSQSVVALQELESMQEDLVKLFDDRFDELNMKIEEMREKVKPQIEEEAPEIPISIEATTDMEEPGELEETDDDEEETADATEPGAEPRPVRKRKPRPKPAASGEGKTDAEKRVDQIRTEVEKVLERLGQMEVET